MRVCKVALSKECPDLKELVIEDNNCMSVGCFKLNGLMGSLQKVFIGKKVFSGCTEVFLSGRRWNEWVMRPSLLGVFGVC